MNENIEISDRLNLSIEILEGGQFVEILDSEGYWVKTISYNEICKIKEQMKEKQDKIKAKV